MVETWEAHDTPTVRARLAQIRSFLNLKMTDRAWTRLNGLSDGDGQESERLALTARMFLARGWSGRAKDLITRLQVTYPDHPDVNALSVEMSQEREKPPSSLPGADAPLVDQLSAAEAFLSASSYLRAKRLLDRMRRQFPDDSRVAELHWALAGDYEMPTDVLTQLVDAHGHVEAGDDNTADGVTSEGTWDDDPYDADEEVSASENTMITRMADLVNLSHEEPLDADDDDDERGDDTRILTVFGDNDQQAAPRTEEKVSHHLFQDTESDVEREDDHIVVMTGRAGYVPPPQTNLPKAVPQPAPRPTPEAGPALELIPMEEEHRPPAGSWAIALIASIFLVGGALMILMNA